jgi:hypothetical protein
MGYAVLSGGELILYSSISRSDHFQSGGGIRVLVSDGFAGTWLPQITAMPVRGAVWAPLLKPAPIFATVLASLAVIVVLGFAATRTGYRALLAAVLLAAYLVAEYMVVGFSRLGFGNIIAIDTRYVADTVSVAGLCLALALTRRSGDRPWRIGRVASTERRGTTWPLIAVALAVGAYAVSAIPVTSATAKAGREAGNQAYISKVRRQLSGRTLTLVDGPVPANVISPLFGTQASLSELTSVLPGRRRFAGATASPYMVDEWGTLKRAAPGPGSKEVKGPEPGCGWSVLSGAETDIALPDTLNGHPGLISIGYVLGAPTPVVIAVAGQRIPLTLRQGLGHIYLVVGAVTGPLVASGVASAVRLCISDVTIGPPAAL